MKESKKVGKSKDVKPRCISPDHHPPRCPVCRETEFETFWNWQIIRKETKFNGETYISYGVHEVYYEGNQPVGWTSEASVVGDTKDDVIDEITRMIVDISLRPILDEKELEKNLKKWDLKEGLEFNPYALQKKKKQKKH